MHVFSLIQLPFCKLILIDPWNAPAVRYFAGFRFRGSFSHVLGLPVISEFSTFSSPLFFAPIPDIGKVYNAGISLAAKRAAGMDIDTGWPPVVVGTNEPQAPLPENWETQLLDAIVSGKSSLSLKGAKRFEFFTKEHQGFTLQYVQFDTVSVYATDAPLVPRQLNRVCEISDSPFSFAFSIGNKITRQEKGQPVKVRVLSENTLISIIEAFSIR